ncbi:WD40 repeat domain-containing serine/threonine protein kinase [Nocardiopsis sp. L17-MgMaSL7]|uniref:WD40 repeat domain-containing serine/threonine protein kinase n=1 Tax=Nocardiopsis sp. L17-MgMaSL7 TaxID=1938893 RepID=UPI000D70ECC9|nr:serine/threonine-protein kinase [Nocardiopsis sp. L17-MgMaSL7]PWV45516.1 serine/threonine protein kinase [Nocardiopsis sp. L17-MgMaSL7]
MKPLTSTDPSHIGPHRLLARLGAGGMGEVHLARTPEGRLAAVKVVKADLAGNRDFRARFAREVRTAQMVVGPFTPRVVDADPYADLPWMATEYVPGPTLKEAVRENGPFPEGSLRVLALGLASAVQAIHAAGLMHRDLKPSNVLLSPRGPQVIDFGIARAVEGTVLTRTGQSFGTPMYTSPEQVRGRESSPASDIFSLAGVVVFAATGKPPFGAGRAISVLPRVVGRSPNLDGVPEALRPVLARCLAKDPDERPSAESIVRELSAGPLPSAEHGWLPVQVRESLNTHQEEARQADEAAPGGPLQDAAAPLSSRPRAGHGGLIGAGAATVTLALVAGVSLIAFAPESSREEASDLRARERTGTNGNEAPDAPADQEGTAEERDGETAFDGFVGDVVFTPDGSGVYVRATDAMTLWEWKSGRFLHRVDPAPVSFDLADDGTMAASFADAVGIFDSGHERVGLFDVEGELEDVVDYRAVSISPDGSLVAVVVTHGDHQRTLYLWDREDDSITHTLELSAPVASTEFSADGAHLKVDFEEGYPRVVLYDVGTAEVVAALVEEAPESTSGQGTEWHATALSPTEPLMAVDRGGGDIALYDYEASEVVKEIEGHRSFSGLAFSSDSETLYSAGMFATATGPSGGRAWDVATGEETTSGDTLLIDRLAVHPHDEAIAAFDRDTLLLLDPETLDVINEIS